MSQGHRNIGGAGMTQNQGNVLGDRPCVRQSRINREHMGGNAMKELMGQSSLKWETDKQQGAYAGRRTFDFNSNSNQCAAVATMHTQQGSNSGSGKVGSGFNQQNSQQFQQPMMMQQQKPQQQMQQQQQQQGGSAAGASSQHYASAHGANAAQTRCAGRANQQTFSAFSH